MAEYPYPLSGNPQHPQHSSSFHIARPQTHHTHNQLSLSHPLPPQYNHNPIPLNHPNTQGNIGVPPYQHNKQNYHHTQGNIGIPSHQHNPHIRSITHSPQYVPFLANIDTQIPTIGPPNNRPAPIHLPPFPSSNLPAPNHQANHTLGGANMGSGVSNFLPPASPAQMDPRDESVDQLRNQDTNLNLPPPLNLGSPKISPANRTRSPQEQHKAQLTPDDVMASFKSKTLSQLRDLQRTHIKYARLTYTMKIEAHDLYFEYQRKQHLLSLKYRRPFKAITRYLGQRRTRQKSSRWHKFQKKDVSAQNVLHNSKIQMFISKNFHCH
jgi:hypothetical protein